VLDQNISRYQEAKRYSGWKWFPKITQTGHYCIRIWRNYIEIQLQRPIPSTVQKFSCGISIWKPLISKMLKYLKTKNIKNIIESQSLFNRSILFRTWKQ
jgi:hypothetical protein